MYPVYYPVAGDTLPHLFDSFDGGTGASITLTGLAVTDIEIYKDGGTTQRSSDAGYTLLDTDGIDFDGITGIHGFSINLSDNTDAGFYEVGPWYHVVVSSVTIDGQTVNFIACAFRIVSATVGLAGTALPNAAADAAGGLAISDAGGLDLDAKLAATNEVTAARMGALTDLIDGGRLDLLIDAIKAMTDKIGTVTNTGGTATLGAILGDFANSALITRLTGITGATFDTGTDSLEAIRNRGDAAWTTATSVTVSDKTGFSLAANQSTVTIGTVTTLTGHTPQTADHTANIGAIKTMTDKIGTITNTGGTATIGAILGDFANSTMVARLNDVPTVAEFEARTLVAASYFDPATDVVAHVTLVDTTTTNTDMVAAAPSAASISDAVWDEAIVDHAGVGSTGAALSAAGGSGDPWSTALPGAYGAGTAGKIIGDNINATVSSRSSHSAADVKTAIEAVGSHLTLILEDTGTTIPGTITTMQGNVTDILTDTGTTLDTLIKDIPTTAEFELRTLAAADYTIVSDLGTVQTGDSFARLGAPAGASVSADIAAVKSDSAAILTDTGTTLDGYIQAIKKAILNKQEITEANGNTVIYADDETTPWSTVAAAYTTDSTTTTRKDLNP